MRKIRTVKKGYVSWGCVAGLISEKCGDDNNNLENNNNDAAGVDNNIPTVTCHGIEWVKVDSNSLEVPGIKRVAFRQWAVIDQFGDKIYPGVDKPLSRLQAFFQLMFPPVQLTLMIRVMNTKLRRRSLKQTTVGELIKFFGIMLLMTRVKFQDRRSLWRTNSSSKYLPSFNFGQTGMTRHRFEELMSHLSWSEQPDVRPEGMAHSTWRWKLIDDFVTNFNRFRASNFVPSDLICVDESMSMWNGIGDGWINRGLPTYVSIDRKPVDGCEIQDACCARSRIMMQIKLVRSDDNSELDGSAVGEDGQPHAVHVLDKLLDPWKHDGERLVAADSYFASVPALKYLKSKGFRFIGMIKTATRGYPKSYFQSLEVQNRGDFRYMKTKNTNVNDDDNMVAVMWVDRDRMHLIGNGEALVTAEPQVRIRWRQVADVGTNEDPERLHIEIREPSISRCFHDIANQIDCHNRQRQDDQDTRMGQTVRDVNFWNYLC